MGLKELHNSLNLKIKRIRKIKWKNYPYWLKGGIKLGIFSILIQIIIFFFGLTNCYVGSSDFCKSLDQISYFLSLEFILSYLLSASTGVLLYFILIFIIYFIIGTIISLIYRKMRNRN